MKRTNYTCDICSAELDFGTMYTLNICCYPTVHGFEYHFCKPCIQTRGADLSVAFFGNFKKVA